MHCVSVFYDTSFMTQLSAFGVINGYQRFKVHLSHSAMIVRLLSSKEHGPDLPFSIPQ